MTNKNKLGWFLLTMFAVGNIIFAAKNYMSALSEHTAQKCVILPSQLSTHSNWSHLSSLESFHIGIIAVASLLGFVLTVIHLIDDKAPNLPAAIAKEV